MTVKVTWKKINCERYCWYESYVTYFCGIEGQTHADAHAIPQCSVAVELDCVHLLKSIFDKHIKL